MANAHDDKRDTERLELSGSLRGDVMVYQPATVHEISDGGMQVETRVPLQLDSLHDFRLSMGGRSIVVKGRVAHCHICDVNQDVVTYRSGIEFVEASVPVAAVIAQFVTLVGTARHNI